MNEQEVYEHQILLDATRYAKEAGALILGFMKKPLQIQEKKNKSDLVTEVDVLSELYLRDQINRDYPDHWILSEETDGAKEESPYAWGKLAPGYGWIIDPIDGTTNFIHGISHFAISIGIVKDGILVCGIVYNPVTADLYSARKQGGAFFNGSPIQVAQEQELSEALLATGFQANDWHSNSVLVEQIRRMAGTSRNVRINGAASLDLCWVASGKLTGFWHDGLYPWDVAAGILIVQEAGGVVTNGAGLAFDLSDQRLIASNLWIHNAFLSVLE
ncbi:myo-inositol-1(or 4)-monophosphatase [Paenibacillus sp. 1_12]|uniref:inositol monophosphatase family protein n=1 Tax=Paenibacillus sp. 1_12 TaxID=1566278 RepID=UPI0008E72040|nr:inositol monophosphatase family protein [Paenibacillus sp. 1_12]SFM18141.1 myo-inositol-1(or 4)-monophosphatase [Paenibacillus sp. 1_12]